MKKLSLTQGRVKEFFSLSFLTVPILIFIFSITFVLTLGLYTPWIIIRNLYGISFSYLFINGFYYFFYEDLVSKSDPLKWLFILSQKWLIFTLWFLFPSFGSIILILIGIQILFFHFFLNTKNAFEIASVTSLFYNGMIYFSGNSDFSSILFILNHLYFWGITYLTLGLFKTFDHFTFEATRHKKKIESLSEFNEVLINSMGSLLFVTDREGIIRFTNNKLNFFSGKESNGYSLYELKKNDKLISFLQGKELKNQVQFVLEDTDLNKIWNVSVTPFNGFDFWKGYIFLIQDYTDEFQLKERLKQKEKLAAIGQLAAGIAHEIRNPLASISGSAQLLHSLSGGLQNLEEKKLLSIIQKESDRLNGLITEFLDYAKPSEHFTDPINLSPLLLNLLEIVKLNPNLDQKIIQNVDLDESLNILGSESRLRQAFLNIIINAYQAMENSKDKKIGISGRVEENEVVIRIRDSGSGISQEQLSKIFEPFHTTKIKGTGLGLAVTHKIIESHQGHIHVKSEPSIGTEFSVHFPKVVRSHVFEESFS